MLGSSQECGVESRTHIVSQKKKKKKGKHAMANISQGDLNPRDSIIDESSQEIIDTLNADQEEENSGRKSNLNGNHVHRMNEELEMKDNLIQ